MKHKLQRLLSTVLAGCFLLVGNVPLALAQQSRTQGVEINDTQFPDEKFRTYIKENLDKNDDDTLSTEEAGAVTYLYLNYAGISDLTGIEHFPNLKTLHVELNRLTTLDVSQNKKLAALYAGNNQLTSLTLPNQQANDTLTHLDVFANQLTALDLTNLNALDFLSAGENLLTTLDLSQNPMNIRFIAYYNNLESVKLPNNGQSYQWTEFLAEQSFPKGMGSGYQTVWYTDPQRTQALDPSKTQTLRLEGQTLYAAYQPIQYTVQFLPGGGNGAMEPQTFTYDQAQALKPNEYTKEHYTFAGWKMPNGKILTDGQQVENLTFKKDQVVTLTATWTERDYTGEAYAINLHANGGTGEDANLQDAVYGTAYTLPAHSFAKENHRFVGWALESGGQAVYEDETSVLIQHPQHLNGEALDLYAVWEKQTYPVMLINGSESQMQNVAHGDLIVFPQIPQKRGYTFDGWYTEGGGKWEVQTPVVQETTLFAKFEPISYTIAFHGNGAENENAMEHSSLTLKFNQEGLLPQNAFTKPYHTFMGWAAVPNGEVVYIDRANVVEAADTEGAVINLYAVWQQNTVAVTLKNGEQTEQKTLNQGDTLTLPTPEKTGYVFNGWKQEGTDMLWQQEDPVMQDLTLTADFTPIQYTIVLDGNGADNPEAMVSGLQMKYDQTHALPQNQFTKANYTFAGWATEPDGAAVYQDQAEVKNLTNEQGGQIRLYAVWSRNVVTLTIHDGVNPAYKISVGQGALLPESLAPQRKGYTLEGWYSQNTYLPEHRVDVAQPVMAGGTLYAKWTRNQYTITFGNIDRAPIEFTVEDSIALEAPYREGYDFLGWQDETGASVSPIIQNMAKSMTLTAVWQRIEEQLPTVTQPDDKEVIAGMQEADRLQAQQTLVDTIQNIASINGNDAQLVASIQKALREGKHVTTQLAIAQMKQGKAQDAWLQQAMTTLNQGHYRFEVGSLMDISAIVRADSTVLGQLSELSAPVRFSIAVPTQMQRTGRIFKVLTMHDGQTFELPAYFENGIVTFETQRFSPFALVYGDPAESLAGSGGEEQTPLLGNNTLHGDTAVQTGDKAGMLVYLAGAVLSAAAAAGLWILRKKTT